MGKAKSNVLYAYTKGMYRQSMYCLILVLAFTALSFYAEHLDKTAGAQGAWMSIVTIVAPIFLTPFYLIKTIVQFDCFEIYIAKIVVTNILEPDHLFDHRLLPSPPNYGNEESWASLPWRLDSADIVPPDISAGPIRQDNATVDVFYLPPTTYFGKAMWNAPYDYAPSIFLSDHGIIPQHASAFNGVGKIYSPRFRQMTGAGYMTNNTWSREQAIKIASSDVERAFKHYLENWNNGRPFIIASHSQGTEHATILLKNMISGKPIQRQLVAAYLIGMHVYDRFSPNIGICRHESDIQCIVSWRTFAHGADQSAFPLQPAHSELRKKPGEIEVCVNPLSWKNDETPMPALRNQGSLSIFQWYISINYLLGVSTLVDRVASGMFRLQKHIVGAQCLNGTLWIDEPSIFGKYFLEPNWRIAVFPGKNYHSYDINFYYKSIRENVAKRVTNYHKS